MGMGQTWAGAPGPSTGKIPEARELLPGLGMLRVFSWRREGSRVMEADIPWLEQELSFPSPALRLPIKPRFQLPIKLNFQLLTLLNPAFRPLFIPNPAPPWMCCSRSGTANPRRFWEVSGEEEPRPGWC